MEKRVYNFSPGPAVLPLSCLQKAQEELLALPGVGISVLEISHRSAAFQAIIDEAEANLRKLLAIPDNYRVLFLQGGAQLQFAMVAMNLLRDSKRSADYIVNGTWGKKAMGEARTHGGIRLAYDGSSNNYRRVPNPDELDLDSQAAYAHFTSNETIQGIQFKNEPETGNVPLVCDASSDFLCRPLPIEKYGILYACAQKNAGPAGVTIVIIRDDLVGEKSAGLPSMLNYKVMAEGKSLYNTPPCFAIYMVKLVTEWLLNDIGGLQKMYEINQRKAAMLYEAIDNSDGFYQGHAEPESRSVMNVTFRLPTPEIEAEFFQQAKERDLYELKGHRSVGGCRASIYNAMPVEGVERLRDFMVEFHQNHRS